MHRHRTPLAALLALLFAAGCGATGPTAGARPAELLNDASSRALVQAAQRYIAGGHYAFTTTGSQASALLRATGLSPKAASGLTSSGAWTASGNVSGLRDVFVHAQFAALGDVSASEVGCDGYASVGGALWAQGESQRTLARLLAPSLDDADVSGPRWHDLGVANRAGASFRHLQADLTPESFAPISSPGAALPHGLTLQDPSTLSLWLRPDGSVAEMSTHITLAIDLATERSRTYPNLGGTLQAVISLDSVLQPSTVTVRAPLATLSADPVPAAVRRAFGPFGVQADSC